jgi:putative CocE/NonD family hydrolase
MRHLLLAAAALALAVPAGAAAPVTPDMVQTGSDITGKFVPPRPGYDYDKLVVMVPMRDGVKLNTIILVPKNARGLPILMERTPYNASGFVDDKPHMRDAARGAFREYVDDGYIIVIQDIRGKYGSQGPYVMTRPPMGPLNPSRTDDTTDAYDTIDWLVKNLKQSNGRVGMIGSSYDGWTVAMALLAPHPALKAAVPESPMIDGWMGDDWYHYGAFRQNSLDYYLGQTTRAGHGESIPRTGADDYRAYLDAGSAGAYAGQYGFDQLPWWKRVAAHPAYDAFWQHQALDKLVAAHPSCVPTIWLQGLWDQEDMYGAITTWEALKRAGHGANNHLVMGPWYHSQINRSADTLGPLKWNGDTAADFRANVLLPFFNAQLKDRAAPPLPEAMIFNASEKRWESFADWPVAERQGLKPLYLQPGFGLGFDQPKGGEDSYVSDPAKPVPFLAPPVDFGDHKRWTTWLTDDQRAVASRPDVLVYETPVLTAAVRVQGAPFADIFLKTTGSDADVVVKIIDVYPESYAEQPELGGYQLPVSLDIFRGRYRNSFEHPESFKPGAVAEVKFRLPTMNYVFKPGHRIMVQVQSSLFPLYDRNPQTFVPNILFAKPSDFHKATISVELGQSAVLLPVK